jgi:hypothetical protein
MSNNKQQTAVEWIKYQVKQQCITHYFSLREILEYAEEIEKEQKKECWDVAHQAGRFEGKGIAEKNWQTFEQYYEQTYGGGEQ